ncbi:DUF4440 domain-containing protein [Paucisalibacillus globulus]|uniref:DUF4440 domain-containing protein n=1 Tax=Paucisalibacillus globulus TaxID=351095 RepID=UPI0004222F48|nr:DUF4440 domain-containing protein [Paucisalibacillus globulus]
MMNNFETVLTNYYQAWNEGFQTKDATRFREFMSKSFTGYWAFSGIEKPEVYDYHYDIVSVLNQYDESTYKEFDVVSSTERKNGENYLVFGTETSMISGQSHQAKCMYVWGMENGDWKLIREYTEMGN